MATRRVTLREAADILGVSKEGVRKRVIRGTLRSDKAPDGRVYVYLDVGDDTSVPGEPDTLVSLLKEQLDAERAAHGETRRLLAAALERIPPQLEPPSEQRGSPEMATEEPQRVEEPRPDTGEPVERPWWRRMFGG